MPPCGVAGNACSACIPPACGNGQYWNPQYCECYTYTTPIIIDTDGTGFHLTSAADGVRFDFFADGKPVQIAWTAEGSSNGWLALDRNNNGRIDSGVELFGNVTPQPASQEANGFLALAEFDKPEKGGNGDGLIDSKDAVWSQLVVWIDANHDGVSQPGELHHLDELRIHSIGLTYRESRRKDAYGNQFRYRGLLNARGRDGVDRTIYDVLLTSAQVP